MFSLLRTEPRDNATEPVTDYRPAATGLKHRGTNHLRDLTVEHSVIEAPRSDGDAV